jgi:hypothetical protein
MYAQKLLSLLTITAIGIMMIPNTFLQIEMAVVGDRSGLDIYGGALLTDLSFVNTMIVHLKYPIKAFMGIC